MGQLGLPETGHNREVKYRSLGWREEELGREEGGVGGDKKQGRPEV